jgi:glycosyltransferase involved in cell wall biosynthesis
MATIGLCVIAKDEARVIRRCLDSVRPLVDFVLVSDTGSSDDTQEIVRGWLAEHVVPGVVVDHPWRDFAHNRSLALAALRQHAEIDYALMLDADDVLILPPGFDPTDFKQMLAADVYSVPLRLGSIRYERPQLIRNQISFRYRGVLHEFLVIPDGSSSETVGGFYIQAGVDGARSVDPHKYRKDADLLSTALTTERDPFMRARYIFYLAQSLRDSGDPQKALPHYLARAELGFWAEEIFVSLWRAAQLMEELNYPSYQIIGMYLRAWEACPSRAESLYGAARYCRATDRHHQGYLFARRGQAIAQPSAGLFIEAWIYDYGLLDELAVTAYWTANYDRSVTACLRLLDEGKMPETMRERVERNLTWGRHFLRSGEVNHVCIGSHSRRC